MVQTEREPMREREASGLPPRTDRIETPESSGDVDEIPPEAVEEARRWEDVPMDEPEESTGTDV